MRRRSFTLLELLVVISILATLAGVLLVSLSGVQHKASGDLTVHELAQVKAAILGFRADTGFLPKQGPFALTSDGGSVPVPAEGEAWFDSPANFTQVLINPLAGTGHPLETFNPDTRRGWRGPYLTRSAEGAVVVGDGLALDGRSGNLDQGTLLAALPSIADPFPRSPLTAGIGVVFNWTNASGDPLPQHGRPFLLFDLADPNRARVIGLGPDGRFSPLPATGDLLTAPGSDDAGVYLFR